MILSHARTGLAVCCAVATIAGFSAAHARQVGPGADLCAEMNRLSPGEELILLPGRYQGPCSVRTGGAAQHPIVIRSADLDRPAVLVYHGRTANVLDIRADNVVIRGLAFESTHPEADGIRIYARSNVVVEDCQFSKLGGIAIVANHNSARGIAVRRNTVKQSRATAMYFGCHDGKRCMIEELLIERNYIHGVNAPVPLIGYGIQVKLNSVARVRDNIVVDTKGPGIMVYGAQNPSKLGIVEKNFVMGSRHSSGIVIGGGPVLVQNNILVHNARAGIATENYGQRDLLRGIAIAHNTAVDNGRGGIVISEKGGIEAVIVNNAGMARADEQIFPVQRNGVEVRGNTDCTHVPCFADVAAHNYSPGPESPLRNGAGDHRFVPTEDYFHTARGRQATVGAVQRSAGPIRFGIKPLAH